MRAGDGGGAIRGQVERRRRDMRGGGKLVHRLLLAEQHVLLVVEARAIGGGPVLDLFLDERGQHPTGADGIAGEPTT